MSESGDFIPAFMLRVLAGKVRESGTPQQTSQFIDGRSSDQAVNEDESTSPENTEKA